MHNYSFDVNIRHHWKNRTQYITTHVHVGVMNSMSPPLKTWLSYPALKNANKIITCQIFDIFHLFTVLSHNIIFRKSTKCVFKLNTFFDSFMEFFWKYLSPFDLVIPNFRPYNSLAWKNFAIQAWIQPNRSNVMQNLYFGLKFQFLSFSSIKSSRSSRWTIGRWSYGRVIG